MEFIAHRINKKEELKQLPQTYGVEIDLRDDFNGRIYMEHDPFKQGEDFEDYLKHYSHGIMILNIKSERIERKALELLAKYGVKKYFFLDSSFPMIYLLSGQGEKNIALRYSEFEGMDTIRNMQGMVEWIWVDCFTDFPLQKKQSDEFHKMGFKICIVSPELQGQPEKISVYAKRILADEMAIDAICTKVYQIDLWKKYLNIG